MPRPCTLRPVPPTGGPPRPPAAAWLPALLLLTLLAVAPWPVRPAAATPATGVLPADELVETIGVNLHLEDPADARFDEVIQQRLLAAGIRYGRGRPGPADGAAWPRLRALAGAGLRVDLVAGADTDWAGFGRSAAALGDRLASVEADDEPLRDGDGPNARLVPVQDKLSEAVQAVPALHGVPVLGPRPGGNTDALAVGLDLGGSSPGRVAPAGPAGEVQVTAARLTVPDEVAARYLPRLWLEQAGRAQRTYLEGLVGDDSRTGLLGPDGSPTPAYHAVANLIGLLADPPAAPSAPDPPGYRLTGHVAGVHQLLLTKRDGRALLALWVEQPSYDPSTGASWQVPAQPVEVHLAEPAASRVFRPSHGLEPVAEHPAGTTVPLKVADDVLLVELTRAPAGTPAPSSRPASASAAHRPARPTATTTPPEPGGRAAAARAAQPTRPGPAPAADDPLAFTGAASLSLLAASAVLVLVGLLALAASHRRHHRH